MGVIGSSKGNRQPSAHLVAQAALVLAERAYANGQAEDAAHLVDVAHRLFGAALETPGFIPTLPH